MGINIYAKKKLLNVFHSYLYSYSYIYAHKIVQNSTLRNQILHRTSLRQQQPIQLISFSLHVPIPPIFPIIFALKYLNIMFRARPISRFLNFFHNINLIIAIFLNLSNTVVDNVLIWFPSNIS